MSEPKTVAMIPPTPPATVRKLYRLYRRFFLKVGRPPTHEGLNATHDSLGYTGTHIGDHTYESMWKACMMGYEKWTALNQVDAEWARRRRMAA